MNLMLFTCVLTVCFACALAAQRPLPRYIHYKDAPEFAVFDRLPQFYTSDPTYDAFVNEYFMRHMSVDERAVYFGGVQLGIVDHMWVIEWDAYMLPWIDRPSMGRRRQGNSTIDVPLTTLLNCAIDKYGYVFGARLTPEAKNAIGGHIPMFGWPWPKHNRNYSTPLPTGWDFNDPADGARDQWQAKHIELESGYVDFSLEGTITGPNPELISPALDSDVFQVPIVELDITYKSPQGKRADQMVGGLKVYWTTDREPEFGEERMVTVDYCDLPPADFPRDYAPYVNEQSARYPLYFPMCMHSEWGREGRRITRIKLVPTGAGAEGTRISLNYLRASYDVRLTTTNSTLIHGVYRFYMWSGDDRYLRMMMPKLRRAMVFLNEHLRGKKDGLLNLDWYVGHDGLGGWESGHGVHGSYWDLMPSGRYDIESSLHYYSALRGMAELERVARAKGWVDEPISVVGPDDKSTLGYSETPESLDALAKRVKSNIEEAFWVPQSGRFCRNVDANGQQHDYGFVFFNMFALALGVGTDQQRDSILSWLDGRVIEGDTSTGEDIYRWRFAPRTTTKRNETYYYWAWNHDRKNYPENAFQWVWGDQTQDGGGLPFTSHFELITRAQTGRQEQIDRAFARTREIQAWYNDVKSAGGQGSQFYRAYYDNNLDRGRQQSPLPGGLGLDREFLSDSSLGTIFLFAAFLGIDSTRDGVIHIAPALPTDMDKIGVRNVFFRGNHLVVEAGKGYVSLEGSRMPSACGLKAEIVLRNLPRSARVTVNGEPRALKRAGADGILLLDLAPVRVEIVQ